MMQHAELQTVLTNECPSLLNDVKAVMLRVASKAAGGGALRKNGEQSIQPSRSDGQIAPNRITPELIIDIVSRICEPDSSD